MFQYLILLSLITAFNLECSEFLKKAEELKRTLQQELAQSDQKTLEAYSPKEYDQKAYLNTNPYFSKLDGLLLEVATQKVEHNKNEAANKVILSGIISYQEGTTKAVDSLTVEQLCSCFKKSTINFENKRTITLKPSNFKIHEKHIPEAFKMFDTLQEEYPGSF